MCRRVVDELPSEVALHPADEIVMACVRSLAGRPSKERESVTFIGGGETYDTMPNAWYSMMDERDIRARSPCCIPRLKRIMATFDEGCRPVRSETQQRLSVLTTSTSTLTLRTVHQGRRILQRNKGQLLAIQLTNIMRSSSSYKMVMPTLNHKSCLCSITAIT
jgi:hypothetical protein